VKRLLQLAFLVALAGVAWAYTAWPRINDVTTSQTPEYPDLQDRSYRVPENKVAEALRSVLGRLPSWTLKGAGSGPGGFAVQAERRTRVGFVDEVTIRVRREAGRTFVKVRSRSRLGRVDFGQNARNIRELFAALDEELR
jgi:uncharacterized protein (DUF1499 family)